MQQLLATVERESQMRWTTHRLCTVPAVGVVSLPVLKARVGLTLGMVVIRGHREQPIVVAAAVGVWALLVVLVVAAL